jgi:hypothetical protein
MQHNQPPQATPAAFGQPKPKLLRLSAMTVVTCLLSACGGALVKSSVGTDAVKSPGVVYYLPKQLIKVEVVRTVVPMDLNDKLAKAKDSARTLAVTQAQYQEQAQMFAAAAQRAPGAARTELEKQSNMLTGQALAMEESLDKAKITVAAMEDQLRLMTSSGLLQPKFQDRITITKLDPVADTRYRYVAQLNRKAARADDFKLTTTAAGLLSNSDLSSSDQSANVIVAAVNSFGSVLQIPVASSTFRTLSAGAPSDPSDEVSKTCKETAFSFQQVLDPTDNKQLKHLNLQLEAKAPCSRLKFTLTSEPDPTPKTFTVQTASELIAAPIDAKKVAQLNEQLESVCANLTFKTSGSLDLNTVETNEKCRILSTQVEGNGLWYRRQLPYVLNVSDGAGLQQSMQLELPNQAPPELLALDGVALAQADHDVIFVNGMLTEHRAVMPSSALAVANVPGQIAGAIVDIPARLLQLKIDTTKQQTALGAEELKLIKQIAELEAERARQAAAAAARAKANEE